DGWFETPEIRRWAVRPRVLWEGEGGRSLFATVGTTQEDRLSGTAPGAVLPWGSPWPESARTERLDGGLVFHQPWGGRLVQVRASAGSTKRDRMLGPSPEGDRTSFSHLEATLSATAGRHTWVAGGAFDHDHLDARERPDLGFHRSIPALFAQDEVRLSPVWSLSGSLRGEHLDEEGSVLDVRLSTLAHFSNAWSARGSLGSGHALPTPLTEETDAVGLTRVQLLETLAPERGQFASLDVTWRGKEVEAEVGIFTSEVRSPLVLVPLEPPGGALAVVNAVSPLRVDGAELLLHATLGPVHLIVSDALMHGSEPLDAGPETQPVTEVPRHAAEVAAIVEDERRGRVGFEASYIGHQHIEDDPDPDAGSPYWDVSFLAELRIRQVRVFVNALNLADVRLTEHAPFLLPTPSPTGRPTTEVWAPQEGRYFNAGVRLQF
ncbi:MAG TPA: TonB-dependent receptor, partial [Candidatus Polarisedimenticolaceae bacterium]|nr:TonB-dependent receptor [Candidatus Polarisedimenticolaceae bacterium]